MERKPKRGFLVAVDGGAATGKTSLCNALADHLGVPYFNTGLMYRAVALACLRNNTAPTDEQAVVALLARTELQVDLHDGRTFVFLESMDVTGALKVDAVSTLVSSVASHAEVRNKMIAKQREIAKAAQLDYGGLVADGRDVTSVAFPEAQVKILLIANGQRENKSDITISHQELQNMSRDAADSKFADFQTARPDLITFNSHAMPLDELIQLAIRRVDLELPH